MTWKRSVEQPDDDSVRICTKCRALLPKEQFTPMKEGARNFKTYNGVQMPCRACGRERVKKRYWSDPDAGRIRRRAQYAATTTVESKAKEQRRLREWRASWTPEQRETYSAKWRANYVANRGEIRRKQREKYRADPEHRALLKRLHDKRQSRPEVQASERERKRLFKKSAKGRETVRVSSHLRRVRIRETATLTREQWLSVVDAYGGACAYCGVKAPRITLDHVVPLSKGGAHAVENVVPACRSCNVRKNASTLAVALKRLGVSHAEWQRRRNEAMMTRTSKDA